MEIETEYPDQDTGTGGLSRQKMVDRDPPQPSEERKALCKDWLKRVEEAETYWARTFKRMRDDMDFALGLQWGQKDIDSEDGRYTVNLTLRHLTFRKSNLYARNPRVTAKVKEKLWFKIWDEDQSTLAAAHQLLQMPPVSVPPPALANATALMMDYQNGMQQKRMYKRVAKTLELLFAHFAGDQSTTFKTNLKQLVLRVLATGVGYLKLGWHRQMERSPALEDRIRDFSDKVFHLERLMADKADGEINEGQKELEEARLMVESLQENFDVIVKEGLVFDFPRATSVIIDPACTQLKGFKDAAWIAQKFLYTPKKIQELTGVDIGSNFSHHDRQGNTDKRKKKASDLAVMYQIFDLESQLEYLVVKGYDDFLKEPGDPDVKLEQFHPFFALTFNDIEHEDAIFPPSDVHLIRNIQQGYNSNREALRDHRRGNRPGWVSASGVFSDDDKDRLAVHDQNELIELDGVKPGTKIQDVLMEKPKQTVDPALYSVEDLFMDLNRVVGDQPANLGGTSGSTATESSIAETSRVSTVANNVDDLDDFLSSVARASGEILLGEMSQEQVQKIVGDGAVWPKMTAKEIADDIWLSIVAGSSGRPNKAVEIANLERIAPFLIQLPGLNPVWLAKQFLERLDDGLDLTEAFQEGAQSIVSMNGAKQPSTGDPSSDPNAQGPAGGENAAKGPRGQPGGQPGYPALTSQ